MISALWVIAICFIINTAINIVGFISSSKEKSKRLELYDEIAKPITIDEDSVKKFVKEFEREKSGLCVAPNDEPEVHRVDGIKLWTPEECDYLLAMYAQEEDLDVVAKNLNRSVNAVKKKLKKLL